VSTTDIQVFITDVNGNITQLNPIAYTVTLNAPIDPNPTSVGGMVVFPLTGPALATGNSLTIIRVLPQVQSTALANQGILYPEVIESSLDYAVMLDQGFNEQVARCFSVAVSDPNPLPVPAVALRANQQAFFDSNGNLTSGLLPVGGAVISSAMQPVVAAATIAIANQLLGIQNLINTSLLTLYSTGDLKPTHKTVADAGWILWSDGNIGGAASNGTIRANADTQALFTLYYNGYSDALCPIFTSLGANTTRAAQGTAAAAFAANCRVQLPVGAGRAIALAGAGSGLTSRVLGSTTGTETVTPSIPTMAAHIHNFIGSSSGSLTSPMGPYNPLSNQDFAGPNGLEGMNMQATGGSTPANTMQPTTFMNVMVKL
jgi:hypothetical protein